MSSRAHSSQARAQQRPHAALWLLMALGLASTTALAQMLYRWVDDQGTVHYTDKVPPNQADKARSRLSEQGMVVERVPGKLSAAELEQARAAQRQQAADQQLLRRYRTIEDMELARAGQIAGAEARIQAKRSQMRDQTRTLIALYQDMRSLQQADKPVPIDLMSKIDTAMTTIRDGYSDIITNEQQKQVIQAEFAETLARFRVLRRLPAAPPEPSSGSQADVDTVPLVNCRDQAQCHAYWDRAVEYVRTHSDREFEVLGTGLLIAFQDDERETRTFTVAWAQKAADQPVQIYLDIQCKNRRTASLLCADATIPTMRQGFQAAVTGESSTHRR
ncbi:protein of unknown function [Allochromatium warmingii]|uniref:DUF4124 domain-containing protein n=1 Tax=Allochromatium warmingii TaxID=61595 RepID=A0A1H3BKK5_ALLWA|nr:DUF4124 domain-containing protein [Allochromatium warmingii]SDX41619.1 protein of unknown function [Allochromatium warmingii]